MWHHWEVLWLILFFSVTIRRSWSLLCCVSSECCSLWSWRVCFILAFSDALRQTWVYTLPVSEPCHKYLALLCSLTLCLNLAVNAPICSCWKPFKHLPPKYMKNRTRQGVTESMMSKIKDEVMAGIFCQVWGQCENLWKNVTTVWGPVAPLFIHFSNFL